jgi:hypothetical protein
VGTTALGIHKRISVWAYASLRLAVPERVPPFKTFSDPWTFHLSRQEAREASGKIWLAVTGRLTTPFDSREMYADNATHKQPDFFFSVIWQINVEKPSQDKKPDWARTVRLELEAPRHNDNHSLNDLKREVIKALRASDFRRLAREVGYDCNEDYLKRSDADIQNNLTTTLFKVIVADRQIKGTPEDNIQAIHNALHPSVDQVLLEFTEKLKRHFGRAFSI